MGGGGGDQSAHHSKFEGGRASPRKERKSGKSGARSKKLGPKNKKKGRQRYRRVYFQEKPTAATQVQLCQVKEKAKEPTKGDYTEENKGGGVI